MKKLYENIEDIYIKGSATVLSEMITSMDITLQEIAAGTERISDIVMKYSQSNSGRQYEKVVATLSSLENTLYEASISMNEMQHQIVDYQNKILRYEGSAESAHNPNPHLVQRTHINVESGKVQFRLADMIDVSNALDEYYNAVLSRLQNLLDSKNNIASIWLDSQYNDFAEFIEEIVSKSVEALRIFDEYILYLNERIRELS